MTLLTNMKKHKEQLEIINKRIKFVERSLHEEGASTVEYSKVFDDIVVNNVSHQKVIFIWAKNGKNTKRNRLMVKIDDETKPLLECNKLNRLELFQYIDAFTSYLDEHLGDLYLNGKFDIQLDDAINGNR